MAAVVNPYANAFDLNLYEILGVEKTATVAEMRRAWAKRVMKVSPDGVARTADQAARIARLQIALRLLSDPEKRSDYDAHRAQLNNGNNGSKRKADADQAEPDQQAGSPKKRSKSNASDSHHSASTTSSSSASNHSSSPKQGQPLREQARKQALDARNNRYHWRQHMSTMLLVPVRRLNNGINPNRDTLDQVKTLAKQVSAPFASCTNGGADRAQLWDAHLDKIACVEASARATWASLTNRQMEAQRGRVCVNGLHTLVDDVAALRDQVHRTRFVANTIKAMLDDLAVSPGESAWSDAEREEIMSEVGRLLGAWAALYAPVGQCNGGGAQGGAQACNGGAAAATAEAKPCTASTGATQPCCPCNAANGQPCCPCKPTTEMQPCAAATGATQPCNGATGATQPSNGATGATQPCNGATGATQPSNGATGATQPSNGATGATQPSNGATGATQPSNGATGATQPSNGATGATQPSNGATGATQPSNGATGATQPSNGATGNAQPSCG